MARRGASEAQKKEHAAQAAVRMIARRGKLGRATIRRPGRDVSIVVWSAMVARALSAAEALAKEAIDAEVIDLRWIRPMDPGDGLIPCVRQAGA
jgi:pyruvate/2-oxoglutarate/acetoin dehydrogenase E1 component